VILALFGLAIWTLLLFGGLVSEWLARRCMRRTLTDRLTTLSDPATAARRAADTAASRRLAGFVPRYLRACWAANVSSAVAGKITDDIELEMSRSVTTLSAIARLGPMLGLAGTLIPLGPGLVDLARGDVAGLANQLVIAFSTTIVGLLIGIVAFAGSQVRRAWYARDLAGLLFLEEIRLGRESSNT
jgi:biopolymer transport protein ExbB/TolQ